MNTDKLESLPGVGPATAEKLVDAGYTRYDEIATTSVGQLTAELDMSDSKAQKLISAAMDASDIGGFSTGAEILKHRQNNINKITTGVEEIDELLDGGIEEEAITELYGKFAAGKSQFTHQFCVNVQLPEEYGGSGKRAIFVDTEDSYRPERIVQMVRGLDPEIQQACMDRDGIDGSPTNEEDVNKLVEKFLQRVHSTKATNTNHQIINVEKAKDLADKYRNTDFPVGLLCVDSIMGHFRAEYVGRGKLAERQQQLTKHLDDLANFANLENAAVVLANQVQSDPNSFFGDPTKPSGGNVIGHRSTFRVYLRNGKGDKQIFKLEDAPNLKDGEAPFKVEEAGIVDS